MSQLFAAVLLCVCVLGHAPWLLAAKLETRKLALDEHKRTYCLYIPQNATASPPALFLLHGSNRSGCYVAELWKKMADREGIVLIAPDALNPAGWGGFDDPPQMFAALLKSVQQEHAIDERRLYLFGHSAGGHYALLMAALESKYFAAVAVFAGALLPSYADDVALHERNTPIAMFQGADDPMVPLAQAKQSRDLLLKNGFPVEFHELPHTSHTYERYAAEVNPAIWQFLSKASLDAAPEMKEYTFRK